jgi:hypothetical protein
MVNTLSLRKGSGWGFAAAAEGAPIALAFNRSKPEFWILSMIWVLPMLKLHLEKGV